MRLNHKRSINQAEIKAIEQCAKLTADKNISNKNILIYSDSKSALESLNIGYIFSITTKQCIIKLNELAIRANKTTLCWAPSHQVEGVEYDICHISVITNVNRKLL